MMIFSFRNRTRWLCALALAICLGNGAHAQQGLSEAEVKAAFVYNFIRLVDWPRSVFATPESPLVICLLGRDPVEASLPSLEKKRVKDRRTHLGGGSVAEMAHVGGKVGGADEATRR